jgi:hypothetical protein
MCEGKPPRGGDGKEVQSPCGGRETAEAIKLEPRLDRVETDRGDRKLDEILEKQITNQITI